MRVVTDASLATSQTLAVAFVAIGAPCFFFFYRESDGNELSFNMNWYATISIRLLESGPTNLTTHIPLAGHSSQLLCSSHSP